MTKNQTKDEKPDLKGLKVKRDQGQARISSIEAKAGEYRKSLEEARKTADGITKKIAGAVVNDEPLKDLKTQLTKVQNEVAFLTGMVDELEGELLDQAKQDLQTAKADLEEAFIRIMEPKRRAAIEEALDLHSRLEEIKRQWSRELLELSHEYGIGGMAVMETLSVSWQGILPGGSLDPRILAAAMGRR